MLNCLAVGLGGFIGSVMRYLIGQISVRESCIFPVKTFAINIIGAFLIGCIVALAGKSHIDPKLILFLKVGICGGFTTFSTFSLETVTLMKGGNTAVAVAYAALSIVLGIGAVMAGQLVVK